MHSTINLIAAGYQIVKLRWRRFCTKSSTDKQSHRFHIRAEKKVDPSSFGNMSFYPEQPEKRYAICAFKNKRDETGWKSWKMDKVHPTEKKKSGRVLINARRKISQTLLLCSKKCNLFLCYSWWPCHPPSLKLMVGFSFFLSVLMRLSQIFRFLLSLSFVHHRN